MILQACEAGLSIDGALVCNSGFGEWSVRDCITNLRPVDDVLLTNTKGECRVHLRLQQWKVSLSLSTLPSGSFMVNVWLVRKHPLCIICVY